MKTVSLLSLAWLSLAAAACDSPFRLAAKVPVIDHLARRPVVTISTTAKSVADLPICDRQASNVDGFVLSSETFMKCDGTRWRSVRPGGFSGRFVARDSVRFHEWEDQVAKQKWSSPSERALSSKDAEKTCEEGWRLPSVPELQQASRNGLVEGMRAHGGRTFAQGWTADFNGKDRIAVPMTDQALDIQGKEAGVYCIRFSDNS